MFHFETQLPLEPCGSVLSAMHHSPAIGGRAKMAKAACRNRDCFAPQLYPDMDYARVSIPATVPKTHDAFGIKKNCASSGTIK
jgi:hypothetical protein